MRSTYENSADNHEGSRGPRGESRKLIDSDRTKQRRSQSG